MEIKMEEYLNMIKVYLNLVRCIDRLQGSSNQENNICYEYKQKRPLNY